MKKLNKLELVEKIRHSEGFTLSEKSELIELINHNKRYGLVWEEKNENAELELLDKLPVLSEEVGKAIINKSVKEAPNHVLIEGDNLHALTALCFTHENRIDVIYIDPPYNTGNKDDFKYNDKYVDKEDAFRHSKWISFMNRRLKLSKKLLKDNGVIFISIGEDELSNLELLMNEIYGENNLLSIISRVSKTASNKGNYFAPSVDYILCYAKNKALVKSFTDKVDETLYKKVETEGDRKGDKYRDDIALYQSSLDTRPNQKYFILCPDGSKVIPPTEHLPPDEIARPGDKVWRWSKADGYARNKHLLVFKKTKNSPLLDEFGNQAKWNIYTKSYLSDRQEKGTLPRNFLDEFINRKGADLIKRYDIEFAYSKPFGLIKHLISITNKSKDILILDFFAGSGTTLHSTILLNDEDKGNRQCILVTNNENNICEEITYVRSKRVISGYKPKEGKEIAGYINNNLRYFKMAFLARERTLKNKRLLTQLSTDVLRIKENCYTEIKGSKNIRIFNEAKLYLVVVFDDIAIPKAVEIIQQLPHKSIIKVYVFSEEQDPYTEDFYEVLNRIELCALPDAIYKAYQHILPKKKRTESEETNASLKLFN